MVKKSCFMFSVILFPIYVGATSFTSNVTGGTVTSNLSMTVKASCSTTVGDVTFGDQSAGDIKKGLEQQVSPLMLLVEQSLQI
ncbi:hypothetical protein [Proteus mirabilis]|uniref:hypothetical protein n=1 Tax=Proteus mirabilis TaxID=584 RepID=UPI0034E392B4